MTERETVVRGLECCLEHVCGKDCPYYRQGDCYDQVVRDALELLRPEEPRLMSRDEVMHDGKAFEALEWRIPGAEAQSAEMGVMHTKGVCEACDAGTAVLKTDYGIVDWFRADMYDAAWRCWTKAPTYDQCLAMPWSTEA